MEFASKITNYIMIAILIFCFAYQGIYFLALYMKKDRNEDTEKKYHRFAVLSAARNEENVIGGLIESIRMQNYPADLIDIYIVADNCTDGTAQRARSLGAFVYERHNLSQIGKGYALNFLLDHMEKEGKCQKYDGYFIFDADNLLDKNYIKEMNRVYCRGYEAITSYRNTKNFGVNWLTSGYGLWFLHEAEWLNKARMLLGVSCAVSGTGFFFSRKILERMGGWHYFLLTEDIEFTISQILQGEKIGYCGKAVFYDEQPEKFIPSWNQRARWIKGYQQVFAKYGKQMFRGVFREKRFSCYDMTMAIWPAFFILAASIAISIILFAVGKTTGRDVGFIGFNVVRNLIFTYLSAAFLGAYTLFTEWKKIRATTFQKLRSILTFPIFMFSFLPIAFVALAKKVEWKPIAHHRTMELDELESPEQVSRKKDLVS